MNEFLPQIIIIIIAVSFITAIIRLLRVKLGEGVFTDAQVIRVEEEDYTDSDGLPTTIVHNIVGFHTEDGFWVEAELINVSRYMTEGEIVRIKYLPDDPQHPILVKE